MASVAIAPAKRVSTRFQLSVAQLLGALLVTAILPIGTAATVLLVQQRDNSRIAIHDALVDTAQHLTVALDRELARGRTMLETVAESQFVTQRDWARLHDFATRAVSRYPGSVISAISTEGQLIFRTAVPFGTPLPNVWETDAEARVEQGRGQSLALGAQDLTKTALATRAPAYSNLYYGVATQRPRVAIAIPVLRAERPVVILTLSFAPDAAIHELLVETQGTDLRLAVIDRRGLIIATNDKTVLKTGDRVGKRFGEAVESEGTGMIEGHTVTGEPVLIGFSTSPTSGWIVRVSRSSEEAYRSMNVTFYLWSSACATVLLLACALAWLMSRRISVPLRELTRSLTLPLDDRKVGLSASGIREIDTLSAASATAAAVEMERENDRLQRSLAEQNALQAAEKEQWLRLVLNNLFVFVGILDRNGCLLESNQAPLDIAGLSRADVIGRPFWECYWWSYDEAVRDLLRSTVERAADGETVRYDIQIRVKDGRRITIDFQLAPVIERDGSIRYLISSGVDVTQRIETEHALREAGERKNQFIAMLSHELRNPLAPITTSLALLNDASSSPEIHQKAREILQRQVAQLSRLVNDLLDVNRFTRGKVVLQKKVVDLCELAKNAVDDYRQAASARQLQLSIVCEPEAILVKVDPARITQVIKNLLENAMKHTPAGGAVMVTVDVGLNHALLTVFDTGEGIAPELLSRIFEPFVQGAAQIGSTHGGLGLGLALVKEVVEGHDGSVTAQSDGVGRGARFTVRLPITTDPENVSVPAPTQHTALGRSVLVVDDNSDSAEAIAMLLRATGYNAEAVTSGEAALRRVARNRPDVVICDLGMPGMDGYAVARALKAHYPGLTLIALTGFAQPQDLQRTFQAGFDFHLAKPVDAAALAAAVDGAVRPCEATCAATPDTP